MHLAVESKHQKMGKSDNNYLSTTSSNFNLKWQQTLIDSPNKTKFDVFISYASSDARQKCGDDWFYPIRELKRAVESHRHPADSSRFRSCTFDEDFELHDSLPDAIKDAIASSKGLIVVCGIGAAASPHVTQEVQLGEKLRGENFKLIAAWLDTDPAQVWPLTFRADDLGLDLVCPPTNTVAAWRERIVMESHKLVARIWNLPLNDVHDRHASQARLRRRRMVGSLVAGAILVTSIGSAAFFSWLDSQYQESGRLGQAALSSARVSCLDPRGLVEGIQAVSHLPDWLGEPHSVASYGLHTYLDRARRELTISCSTNMTNTWVDFDNENNLHVSCGHEETWRIEGDWPPRRNEIDTALNRATSEQTYDGPSLKGVDWTITAKPGASISIEKNGQNVKEIPVGEKVWRLAASKNAQRVAWLEEDNTLRAWDETGIIKVVARDISHSTALFVPENGESVLAGVDLSFGVFNTSVVRWDWDTEKDIWQPSGILHPYGGPIQSIKEASESNLFSVATDHNGLHLWEGGFDVPVAVLHCPQRVLSSTAVTADGETVLAGWIANFATRWQRNATRAEILATDIEEVFDTLTGVTLISNSGITRYERNRIQNMSEHEQYPDQVLVHDEFLVSVENEKILIHIDGSIREIDIKAIPIAIDPNGEKIYVSDSSETNSYIAALDLYGNEFWRLPQLKPQFLENIMVSSGGGFLYGSSNNKLFRVDTSDGSESLLREIPVEIRDIQESSDGSWLLIQSSLGYRSVISSTDGTLRWEKQLPIETLGDSIFVDSDTVLADSGDGRIQIYKLPSTEPDWTLMIAPTGISEFAVSRDGKTIAVDAFSDIHLVDVESRALKAKFQNPGRFIDQLFFGESGAVFALSNEGHFLRFDSDKTSLLREACSLADFYSHLRNEVQDACSMFW